MAYLLPADPATNELDCVLVYFPNRPEYRQALFGQIAELSDVWNWEGTREKQALARAAWLAAELETLKNMSCLDELLAEVQAINAKLPWCCDTSLPTIEIEPVEGPGGVLIWPVPGPAPLPVPDNDTGEGTGEYPITPGTDPDDGGTVSAVEWEQYLCGAANFLADALIDWLRFVRFQRRFTSQLGSSVRWLQAFIAGRLIPGVMDDFAIFQLDDLIDEVVNAFENVFIEDLDTAISQLENIRDDLICAIVGENTAANAITAALNFLSGEIANAFVMSLIGSPLTLVASLIWNGAFDVSWDDGCDCEPDTGLYWATTLNFLQYSTNGGGTWTDYDSGVFTLPVINGQEILWRQNTAPNNTVLLFFVDGTGDDAGSGTWECEYVATAGNAVTCQGYSVTDVLTHAAHNLFVGTTESGITAHEMSWRANIINVGEYIRTVVTGASA